MSVNESGTNKTSQDIVIQGLEQQLEQCRTQNAKLEAEKQLMDKMLKKKKGGRKRKTKKRRQKGGAEDLSFKKPMVSQITASDAIQGSMHKQSESNKAMSDMNKQMSGGGDNKDGVVVPQLQQAGASGNQSITNSISTTLQGRADAEYDQKVFDAPKPSGMPGGGRRKRRRKTKKRRRKRKTKKQKRKTKKRRRKRKTKKRRR